MKISVSTYSFHKLIDKKEVDLFKVCDLAKELGFDGIEFTELPDLSKASALGAYCKGIGLPVVCYSVGASFVGPFPSKTVTKLRAQIDAAVRLGAPVMRHDVATHLPLFCRDWKKAAEKMVPYIRSVSEYGASKGVKTCTENHGMLFQNPERVEFLIKAVHCDNYGWLCDVGNFLCADCDPTTSVKVALPYTVHVHLKDFAVGQTGDFRSLHGKGLTGTVLGKGVVPVKEIISVLNGSGYDGWYTVEFEGHEETASALKEALAFLRKE